MRVHEALELFGNIPKIRRVLQTLADVGLDYLVAGPGGADAVRRRGPARQAGRRAGPAQHRQDALHPRRADHRPALRRHPQAARRAQPPGRSGQHGHRRRAQPGRDQDGRLGHRPRPRSRRRRRPRRRRRARRKTVAARSPGSHTAPVLAPVLAAGPHVERPTLRPASRRGRLQEDDVPLEAVGRDAAMPWETDGRRWHTVERVTTTASRAAGKAPSSTGSTNKSTSWATFGDTNWNAAQRRRDRRPEQEPGLVPARHDRHGMAASGWCSASASNTFKSRELVAAPRHPAAERDAGRWKSTATRRACG